MIVRIVEKRDISALKILYQELEKDAVRFQPEHFVLSVRGDDFFENIFEKENQDILVAEKNGQVIGFIHVIILTQKNVSCLKPQTCVYIQDMDVAESERRRGIGAELIDASKTYGKTHGADFIRTQVFPQNKDGIHFYEHEGFTEMMKTIECPI